MQALTDVTSEPVPETSIAYGSITEWYNQQYNELFSDASEIMMRDLINTTIDLNMRQTGMSTVGPPQNLSHLILNIDENQIIEPPVAMANVSQAASTVNASNSVQQAPIDTSSAVEVWGNFDFSTFTGLTDSEDDDFAPI